MYLANVGNNEEGCRTPDSCPAQLLSGEVNADNSVGNSWFVHQNRAAASAAQVEECPSVWKGRTKPFEPHPFPSMSRT